MLVLTHKILNWQRKKIFSNHNMVIISIMIIMIINDNHHNPSTQVMEMNFREALDTTHTVSCSDEQVLYVTISVTIGISATLTIIIIATFQAWAYGASLYNYLNSVQTTGEIYF